MKLADYLKAIKECPDELVERPGGQIVHRLTNDLGIYDNWPIFLGSDAEFTANKLLDYNFRLHGATKERHSPTCLYYIPGTTIVNVIDLSKDSLRSGDLKACGHEGYKTFLMLHSYQGDKPYEDGKEMPGVHWTRAMAHSVEDISRFIQENQVSACFFKSKGWANSEDFTRRVYFPDFLEEEMISKLSRGEAK